MVQIILRRDADLTRTILTALPEWFGDPDAIDNYAADTKSGRFTSYVAASVDTPMGVALVRRHFPEAAELHLIAVAPSARGRGIGRALVERVAMDLVTDGCQMLTVHTVGPSFDHDGYAQTRAFYRSVGFTPLEEHENLDWPGPTVIMVRPLAPGMEESPV